MCLLASLPPLLVKFYKTVACTGIPSHAGRSSPSRPQLPHLYGAQRCEHQPRPVLRDGDAERLQAAPHRCKLVRGCEHLQW